MAKLSPYVFFKGNAQEAFTFYKDCLGGELFMQTVGNSPAASHMPPEMQDKVMHADLSGDSFSLLGSDMTDPNQVTEECNIALTLMCTSEEEMRTLFSKLSEGGQVNDPINETFFGLYGKLTDRFGITWMLQYSKDNQ